MLPGGLLVLGVFLITSPDLSKDVQNALRKLVFAVEKSSMKNRLWHFEEGDVSERIALHICSATRKVTCRTFDVNDPKSTAKPADWKYQNFASSWLMIDCNVHLDVTIPLTSSSFQDQQKSTRLGLAKWAKEIENAVVLFNGQTKDINEDLFEDLKKSSRSANHSSPQIITTNILTSSPVIEDTRTTALVQSCKSSLTIHGVVKCRGYVHSNRPKVKDAVQAIKRDILNTTKDRCEILFEDIILNGLQREKDVWQLPQRVFVPIHGSSLLLCDYLFGDETANDLQSHFLEILDQDVQQDGLEFTEQKSSKTIAEEKENISQPQHTTGVQTNSSKSSSEIRLNKGFL
ncbi:hypothetical protein GDO86_007579 [Hymenochirus boettgeri]|uniref:Protein odr-4 homolog n=1 Tax=Hymenochirus boettgeri TaxID=247094 RepID=A0A8T2IZH1_9PIPI|nr:hypothetical protein GDO86_007579 [Hymenochirus boettgeri]